MVDLQELELRFRGAEGEWYDRYTVSQDLPQLAVDALSAGWDTQSLRVLAGESADAYFIDLGELFARAAVELGRAVPTPEQACWAFVQYLCWLIASERTSPIDGARRMERLQLWELPEVAHFSGVIDEWEGNWGRSRAEVEDDIRATAREVTHRTRRTDAPGNR